MMEVLKFINDKTYTIILYGDEGDKHIYENCRYDGRNYYAPVTYNRKVIKQKYYKVPGILFDKEIKEETNDRSDT